MALLNCGARKEGVCRGSSRGEPRFTIQLVSTLHCMCGVKQGVCRQEQRMSH
jgi:hypothetical protein